MTKIVIGPDSNGLQLSPEACQELGLVWRDEWEHVASGDRYNPYPWNDETGRRNRDDPALVAVVERLGADAGQRKYEDEDLIEMRERYSLTDTQMAIMAKERYKIKIVDIPDDVDWYIAESEETGAEWIAERHRTWC